MNETNREIVRWSDTVQIVDDIIRQHEHIKGLRGGQIILVGGSAMLAHSVRISSGDVDIFSPDLDADIVLDLESDLQKKFGEDFRIDLTPTENLWGNLLIRDIAVRSPMLRRVETPTSCWDIKALDVETLFLVKLEAGRKKDMEDLVSISSKTSPELLADRFREMVKWHGLPDAIIGYADRFVEKMHQLYAEDPTRTIKKIEPSLSKRVTGMLRQSWIVDTHSVLIDNAVNDVDPDGLAMSQTHRSLVVDQEKCLDMGAQKQDHTMVTSFSGRIVGRDPDGTAVYVRAAGKIIRLVCANPSERFPDVSIGQYGRFSAQNGTIIFSEVQERDKGIQR